jgi:hypothetical protein
MFGWRLSQMKSLLPLLMSAQKLSIVKLEIFSIKVELPNIPVLFWPLLQPNPSPVSLLGIQTRVACAALGLNIDPEIGAKNSGKAKRPIRKSGICAELLVILITILLLPKISLTTPKFLYNNFYNNFPNVFFDVIVCLAR